MLKRVDHIAVAVANLDEVLADYADALGLEPSQIITNEALGLRAAIIPVGNCEFELLGPIDPKNGAEAFLSQWGSGIHHICMEVDNIDKQLPELEAKGATLRTKEAQQGPFGKIAYFQLQSTKGVLMQLVDKSQGQS